MEDGKVRCSYCGELIQSFAKTCPFCHHVKASVSASRIVTMLAIVALLVYLFGIGGCFVGWF